jgi:hypothetical protein
MLTAELIETVLGCGGCIYKVGFEYFGAQFELGLAIGLELGLGLDGVKSNWV